MKNYLFFLLLLVLFLIGLFFRTYKLDQLPSEMHRDEVAIGYNAYSVFQTGKDEYGVSSPIVYKSFGDYKLPGMLYSVALSERIFGLNTFAVRFPTALAASLLIPISFWLAQELWNDRKRSVVVSSLVTFAQWHTYLARTAYEPMMALTLYVVFLICLLKARKSPVWFIPSLVVAILSFFTYNVPLLITPLLVGGTLYIYKDFYKKHLKITMSYVTALAVLVLGSYLLLSSATDGKLKATIFANEKTHEQARIFSEGMMLGGIPYKITQLFVSPQIFTLQAFIKNYLGAFDPTYLFFKGGINPWHSLGVLDLGNFNLFTLPLILLSGYLLSRKKIQLDKGTYFVLLYLLISPLPDAITIDAPVTNRLLDFHFGILLFSSIGVWWLIQRSKHSKMSQLVLTLIFAGMAGYYVLFWSRYATLHSKTLDVLWYEGISETAQLTADLEPTVDRVYIDLNQIDAHQLTHLYFAFYAQYDPVLYQEQAKYSLDDKFSTTLSFDPYYFIDIPEKLDLGSNYERFFPEGVESVLFVVRLVNEPPYDRPDKVIYDNWHRKPLWQIVRLSKTELENARAN